MMKTIKHSLWVLGLTLLIGACSTGPNLTQGSSGDLDPQALAKAQSQGKKTAALLAKVNRFKRSQPTKKGPMAKDFKQALAQNKQQQHDQALVLLGPYLSADNVYSSVWVLRGDIAAGQKKSPEMQMTYYQRALNVNPDNYLAHNRLAILASRQGQFEQALDHYQKALSSWPGFALAYLNRGILLDVYMGKKQQALGDYEQYQGLITLTQGKPDKKVRAWMVDLKRQLKQQG
jgi:tetratricopeptide (TPR) repeat protein